MKSKFIINEKFETINIMNVKPKQKPNNEQMLIDTTSSQPCSKPNVVGSLHDVDDILDIALSVVFLKYGNDSLQDERFIEDLSTAYDFIQKLVRK